MSNKDEVKKDQVKAAEDAEKTVEELTEEELESAAGGVLIALNQGSSAYKETIAGIPGTTAHKDLVTDLTIKQTFKFKP